MNSEIGGAADVSSSLVLRLFGERWLIDLAAYVDGERLAAQLSRLWARVVENGTDADVVFRPQPDGAQSDAGGRVRTARIPERVDGAFPYAFSRALTQAVIAHLAGSGLLLHAAGLASRDGRRGVVLVASSGTGKSTAARTLGTRFGYLSDELMRVDADNRMQGLTKPLSIIVPGFPGGKDEVSPDDAALLPTPLESPEVVAVVCLERDPEAGGSDLLPISVHELIAEVLPQSSSIWRARRPLHHLVEAGTRGGGPYRLRYSEVADGEQLIADLLSPHAPPRAAHEWIGHLPPEGERWTDDASRASDVQIEDRTVVVRMPWTDAIESEGEVSVLRGSRFSRIAGIAATMWVLCARPHTVTELVDALVREHGPHDDARGLVRGALGDLVAGQLVTTVSALPQHP